MASAADSPSGSSNVLSAKAALEGAPKVASLMAGELVWRSSSESKLVAESQRIQKCGDGSVIGQALQQVKLCDRFGRRDFPVPRRGQIRNSREHAAIIASQKTSANPLLESVAAKRLGKPQSVRAGLHMDSRCTMAANRY